MLNRMQKLFLGILLVFLGGAFALTMGLRLAKNTGTPEAINSLTGDSVKKDMLVEGDIAYNYGAYETLYEQKSGSSYKETLGKYFLIELSDGKLMGVYTSEAKLISEFERQAEEFLDYVTGKSDAEPRKIHIKGLVESMELQDRKMMGEYLTDAFGFGLEDITENVVYLYIANNDNQQAAPILFIGSIVLVIVGIVFIFGFIRSKTAGK